MTLEEFQNITLLGNIPSILNHGILSHVEAAKLATHHSVALQEVQDKRDAKMVPGGLSLHQYANVYFPAAVWAEKEGCQTNSERRVNLTRQALPRFADSRPDFWIFREMAKRFSVGMNIQFPETPEQAFEEMKLLSKGENRMLDISGMSYDKIEQARGIQWPYREGTESLKGDPRLYQDGHFETESGKANLIPVSFVDNNERPCTEFPFWLNSGRVVEHFHTRTRLQRSTRTAACNSLT